jgi:signal transduction histidine kinase
MRLRVDTMDDDVQGAKLRHDLLEMEHLVKEGVAYARTLHGTDEAARRIDLDALLDSIVCDYTDAGQDVALHGGGPLALVTRPKALRRIVGNLVDNAEVRGRSGDRRAGGARRRRGDRGARPRAGHPGRSARCGVRAVQARGDVAQPRYGRHGLGLAIARQLALAMSGTLTLRNREDGGGLEARLTLVNAG